MNVLLTFLHYGTSSDNGVHRFTVFRFMYSKKDQAACKFLLFNNIVEEKPGSLS